MSCSLLELKVKMNKKNYNNNKFNKTLLLLYKILKSNSSILQLLVEFILN